VGKVCSSSLHGSIFLMQNIWQKLAENKKPFSVLAPMAGVTDFVFREMIADITERDATKHSKVGPDLFFTEFISTEMIVRSGLMQIGTRISADKLPNIFHFSEKQKPIIIQFFGSKPEQFEYCARLIVEMNGRSSLRYDGIDINMGCPDKKVQKQGAGSELINNPELAIEIIQAVKKVCGDQIPISVKTRVGYREINFDHIKKIAEEGVAAITIHGRTAFQGYAGKANWTAIGQAADVIKKINKDVIVIGNGDIKDIDTGNFLCQQFGLDGFMIGRQVLKSPFAFKLESDLNIEERLELCLKHTELFHQFYSNGVTVKDDDFSSNNRVSFGAMKKYYKAYLGGFRGASEFRKELMNAKDFEEGLGVLHKMIEEINNVS